MQHGIFRALAARRIVLGACLGSLVANGAHAQDQLGLTEPGTPPAALRIVNWDLSEVPNAKTRGRRDAKRAQWRTSFGSERRNFSSAAPGTADIDADAVLLQGVTSVREVRRHFPARFWKLIVSRQMLQNDDPLNPLAEDASSAGPTTAIAVRFQEGLRVTAQEHLLEFAAASAQPGAHEPLAAGTAVRLSAGAKIFWLLSIELAGECIARGISCPAMARFEAWRAAHRNAQEATLTGGRFQTLPSKFLPPPPCDGRSIEANPIMESTAFAKPVRATNAVAGCVVRLDFPR